MVRLQKTQDRASNNKSKNLTVWTVPGIPLFFKGSCSVMVGHMEPAFVFVNKRNPTLTLNSSTQNLRRKGPDEI